MSSQVETDRGNEAVHKGTCIILCAGKGSVRAAKAVMTRVLTKTLGKDFKGAPWHCVFVPRDEDADAEPRWLLDTTDDEFARLMRAVGEEFEADGNWTGAPVDCYRD